MNVMAVRRKIKKVTVRKAQEAINDFMEEFSDYEVAEIVAELKVPIKVVEGSLKVKLKKKS